LNSGPLKETAVRLEGVSKIYRLFDSKSDRLWEALNPLRRKRHREFWALRDITLEVPTGCTLGILGRNGSGKSTLLQIISNVLQPTVGELTVSGRVAALLELGAGFNADLTARENVYMNGAVMGLNRAAVLERIEDIEAFADIGEFFDQPMKIFSSGMFARIAFATAVHVDPDILIIDEALAVGDAKFTDKCFRRFKDFQDAGKTILYVTHDRYSVTRLCDLAMLLDGGKVVDIGEPREISNLYDQLLNTGKTTVGIAEEKSQDSELAIEIASTDETLDYSEILDRFISAQTLHDRCADNPTYNKNEHRYGTGEATIIDYMIMVGHLVNPLSFDTGRAIDVVVRIAYKRNIAHPILGIHFSNGEGVYVFAVNTDMLHSKMEAVVEGQVCTYQFSVMLNLAKGDWFMDLAVADAIGPTIIDSRTAIAHLRVTDIHEYLGLVYFESSCVQLNL
jgi:lipopolysaccharide transport system ATP-binding protein